MEGKEHGAGQHAAAPSGAAGGELDAIVEELLERWRARIGRPHERLSLEHGVARALERALGHGGAEASELRDTIDGAADSGLSPRGAAFCEKTCTYGASLFMNRRGELSECVARIASEVRYTRRKREERARIAASRERAEARSAADARAPTPARASLDPAQMRADVERALEAARRGVAPSRHRAVRAARAGDD